MLPACYKFLKLLYLYKPAIIHCHYRSTAPFAFFAQLLRGVKSVLTIHLHNMPKSPVSSFFYSKFNACITISTDIEKALTEQGIHKDRIFKVFNGADKTVFKNLSAAEKDQLRIQYQLAPDKLTLLTVARLAKIKSIDTLIKALAEMNASDRDKIQCLIVGGGTHQPVLERLSQRYGLENVLTFTGYRHPHDYYALSDVFILPSLNEGFSVAVVEAMLSGLAILKTPTSGTFDQLEEGRNGYVFPFHDHKGLADRIEQLLHNPHLLKKMQQQSYYMALSRFTMEEMGNNVSNIYEQLLRKEDNFVQTFAADI